MYTSKHETSPVAEVLLLNLVFLAACSIICKPVRYSTVQPARVNTPLKFMPRIRK